VFGLLKGQGKPDLGWGKQGGATYLAFASQSDLILGGPNVLKGVVDKPVGADPAAYGAGLTLIVVYRRAFGVLQRVDVWSGWSSTESSSTGLAEAKLQLPVPWIDGPAHLYLNALDGIDFVGANDELLLNGFSVGGDLDGTGDKTDAWRGLAGPQGASNLYDGLDDSIAAYMDVGDTAILALTDKDPGAGLDDTIGHTLAVFASIAQLGTSTTYCTAKVNSLGCTPDVWGVGVPSVDPTQGPFDIVVDELVNNMNGILFWGTVPSSTPFQGGTLCIGGSVVRTDLQNSGGSPAGKDCSGTMGFDFNAYFASGVAPDLAAGTLVFAQYWTRDVDDPFGSSLSEALAFDLAP
jgi:hypothetical protein